MQNLRLSDLSKKKTQEVPAISRQDENYVRQEPDKVIYDIILLLVCYMPTSLYLTAHNRPNGLDFSGLVFAALY